MAALDPRMLEAFTEELSSLVKAGAGPSFLSQMVGEPLGVIGRGAKAWIGSQFKGEGGIGELFSRMHPLKLHKGLSKSWEAMAPLGIAGSEAHAKELAALREAATKVKGDPSKGIQGIKQTLYRGPQAELHLLPEAERKAIPGEETKGVIRRAAEELSRRGWTGRTRMTKYLPIGMKTQTVGFTVPSVYSMATTKPSAASPDVEGGAAEQILGGLGSTVPFLMSGGMGLPAMAVAIGGGELTGRAGRIIDRLRGGATLRQAIAGKAPEAI